MIGTTLDPGFNRATRQARTKSFKPGHPRTPRYRSGKALEQPSCLCLSHGLVPDSTKCARHGTTLKSAESQRSELLKGASRTKRKT